jgi:hypothetical protein
MGAASRCGGAAAPVSAAVPTVGTDLGLCPYAGPRMRAPGAVPRPATRRNPCRVVDHRLHRLSSSPRGTAARRGARRWIVGGRRWGQPPGTSPTSRRPSSTRCAPPPSPLRRCWACSDPRWVPRTGAFQHTDRRTGATRAVVDGFSPARQHLLTETVMSRRLRPPADGRRSPGPRPRHAAAGPGGGPVAQWCAASLVPRRRRLGQHGQRRPARRPGGDLWSEFVRDRVTAVLEAPRQQLLASPPTCGVGTRQEGEQR